VSGPTDRRRGFDVTLLLLLIFLAGFLVYAAVDIRRKQCHVDLHRDIRAYLTAVSRTSTHRRPG
jgi:hypothetical protein